MSLEVKTSCDASSEWPAGIVESDAGAVEKDVNACWLKNRLVLDAEWLVEDTVEVLDGTRRRVTLAGQPAETAARDRHGPFGLTGGAAGPVKKYSESLLKMVTSANKTDRFRTSTRIDVASSVADIAADLDPPLLCRGRAS